MAYYGQQQQPPAGYYGQGGAPPPQQQDPNQQFLWGVFQRFIQLEIFLGSKYYFVIDQFDVR